MERFENSVCKCDHIKEGTCKQCSACDRCEFYSQKIPFAEEVVCRIVGNGFYVGNHYVRFCKQSIFNHVFQAVFRKKAALHEYFLKRRFLQ